MPRNIGLLWGGPGLQGDLNTPGDASVQQFRGPPLSSLALKGSMCPQMISRHRQVWEHGAEPELLRFEPVYE